MRTFYLILAICAVASCSKDDDNNNNCSLSEATLVGSYSLTSVRYKASSTSTEVNYMDETFEPCQKDDIITLKSDHTYNHGDEGTACSPADDYSGTWNLSGNSLVVDGASTPIEDFTCKSFSLIQTDTEVPGDKLTLVYTKQ
jgi:hypothetical protein